jgi:polysaccharide biosynthesis protein PslH
MASGYLVRQSIFLEALSICGEVTAVLFYTDQSGLIGKPAWLHKLFILPPPPSHNNTSKLIDLARDLLDPRPRMLRRVDVGVSRKRFRELNLDDFDLLFAYRFDFAYWAGVLGTPDLLLDIDDPEHLRRQRQLETRNNHVDFRTRIDLIKLRSFERKWANRVSRVFVCQDKDRDPFWPVIPEVVPNAVSVPDVKPVREGNELKLLFLGSLTGSKDSANIDGVLWFVEKVWPLILARVPDVVLDLVGQAGSFIQQEIAPIMGIRFLGFIESIDVVFRDATASIVPIRFGTGTRIKILDAMAHGCPVVSTSMGADGLGATPDKNLLIADSEAQFANHCVSLLTKKDLREKYAAAGFSFVKEKFLRDNIVQQLSRHFGELLANR